MSEQLNEYQINCGDGNNLSLFSQTVRISEGHLEFWTFMNLDAAFGPGQWNWFLMCGVQEQPEPLP